jgi:hypothetical protein
MPTSDTNATGLHRRPTFGLVALGASATVALLIGTGVANPYPDLEFAYILCGAVALAGLVQLISR